jgi:copper chaperone CopZ/bacterioferritin-associated ferredoxin
MKKIEVTINGMTCPSCSSAVERLVDELDGVKARNINHVADSGKIEFDENVITEEEIIAKINEGHYKVDTDKEIIENKIDIPECPICNTSGQLVPNTVFRANVKVESSSKFDLSKNNYICLNPICNVAYYSNNTTIDKTELKRELWYKKGTERKIICYCNNIDKSMIKDAIANHNLSTWGKITSHYRTKVVEKCELLNPTGFCCRNTFAKVVGKVSAELKQ